MGTEEMVGKSLIEGVFQINGCDIYCEVWLD